jgi:hypothetical protein
MVGLVNDLQRIAGIFGEFHWDASGISSYDAFYRGLYDAAPDDHRMEGYHWRKKVHVLKVAMLLSLAERDELLLDEKVITAATQFMELIEGPMSRTFSAVGKYDRASDLERIGTQLVAADGLSVADVFRRNYFAGSEQDLRSILSSLSSMGIAKLVQKDGKEYLQVLRKDLPWGVK